jgi:hypothetical protein
MDFTYTRLAVAPCACSAHGYAEHAPTLEYALLASMDTSRTLSLNAWSVSRNVRSVLATRTGPSAATNAYQDSSSQAPSVSFAPLTNGLTMPLVNAQLARFQGVPNALQQRPVWPVTPSTPQAWLLYMTITPSVMCRPRPASPKWWPQPSPWVSGLHLKQVL